MLEILKVSNVLRSIKFAANLFIFPVIFGISKHFADVAATLASFRDLRALFLGHMPIKRGCKKSRWLSDKGSATKCWLSHIFSPMFTTSIFGSCWRFPFMVVAFMICMSSLGVFCNSNETRPTELQWMTDFRESTKHKQWFISHHITGKCKYLESYSH